MGSIVKSLQKALDSNNVEKIAQVGIPGTTVFVMICNEMWCGWVAGWVGHVTRMAGSTSKFARHSLQ
jgi:hypothetical protein